MNQTKQPNLPVKEYLKLNLKSSDSRPHTVLTIRLHRLAGCQTHSTDEGCLGYDGPGNKPTQREAEAVRRLFPLGKTNAHPPQTPCPVVSGLLGQSPGA